MAKTVYTAEAHVTGGRANGRGRTSDGRLEVDLRLPEELGGQGGGTNPEQLFAVGYAACFESSLLLAAQRAGVAPEHVSDAEITARVDLIATGERGFELGVELHVTLPSISDPHQATELVRLTHATCPYSRATRGNIPIALVANGAAVAHAQPAATASRPAPVLDG